MAVLTPGGTTGWNIEKWKRTIDPALYQRAKMLPVVEQGDKPGTTGHYRLGARVAGSALGQSSDGTGLSYLTIIGTPVTLSARGNHVPVGWSRNQQAQLDVAMNAEARGNVEEALTELTETVLAESVATLTNPAVTGPDITGPLLRRAVALLQGNTRGASDPDGPNRVYGLFSHTQLPALGEIPEYNQAEMRGDSENPYVKGVWMKGGGVGLALISTVVYFDGSAWNNCLFLAGAFIAAWNERSTIVEDQAELQSRVIAYNNLASGVKYNDKALRILTTSNLGQ